MIDPSLKYQNTNPSLSTLCYYKFIDGEVQDGIMETLDICVRY